MRARRNDIPTRISWPVFGTFFPRALYVSNVIRYLSGTLHRRQSSTKCGGRKRAEP